MTKQDNKSRFSNRLKIKIDTFRFDFLVKISGFIQKNQFLLILFGKLLLKILKIIDRILDDD